MNSRRFDAAAVTTAHGPLVLAYIEALLLFDRPDSDHGLPTLRAWTDPVRDAIASGEVKPIARAILATIRRMQSGRSTLEESAIPGYWRAVNDATACVAGLDASLVLLSRVEGLPVAAEAAATARTLREAFAMRAGEPTREIRSAKTWGNRTRFDVAYAAASFWSDGVPMAPDWQVLGEPEPPARLITTMSSEFPLPFDPEGE